MFEVTTVVRSDLRSQIRIPYQSKDQTADAVSVQSEPIRLAMVSVCLPNDLYCVEWDVKLYYTIPQ